MGKRQRAFLPYSSFATPEVNATLFSSLANRGESVRLASDRRIDVPEKVGGPASCGHAERLGPHQGLRPLATPTGVGDRLSHEAMNPGTGEIDEAPSVDAGPERPSVAQGGGDPERLGDGPGRWGGPHPCVDTRRARSDGKPVDRERAVMPFNKTNSAANPGRVCITLSFRSGVLLTLAMVATLLLVIAGANPAQTLMPHGR